MNSIKKIKNQEGFTLLEILISLSITSLCFLLLSIGVVQIKELNHTIKTDKQIEWHLFLNQLDHYLIDSRFTSNTSTILRVEERVDGQLQDVRYQKSGTKFIRRLNGGNQPLLMDIQTINITKHKDSILIKGIFDNGETYKARIWVNSWDEKYNSG